MFWKTNLNFTSISKNRVADDAFDVLKDQWKSWRQYEKNAISLTAILVTRWSPKNNIIEKREILRPPSHYYIWHKILQKMLFTKITIWYFSSNIFYELQYLNISVLPGSMDTKNVVY
jgi:hypothetical protein